MMKQILMLFFVGVSVFGQNKLDKSKKELTAQSKNKSQPVVSAKNTDSEYVHPVLEVAGYIFLGAFRYGLIGDYKNENHLHNRLTPYPFYDGVSGNFIRPQADTITKSQLRIDAENNLVYSNNDLYGNHFKAKIRPFRYFYLQGDFHQLYESNEIDNLDYRLSLFHFNLGAERIRFEKFNFGWTLGVSYVGNQVRKAGFSYGLNAEYFMGNHISFLASAKWSTINSRPVNAFELQGKFHRKRYFFALGFQRLKIAAPTYNFIALGGGIYL